jgi:hypothetical protein
MPDKKRILRVVEYHEKEADSEYYRKIGDDPYIAGIGSHLHVVAIKK